MPRRSALPGFGLTLGMTLAWLSLIVLVPLAALVVRPWELGVAGVWHSVTEPRVLAGLRLSFGTAALAATINVPIGMLIAWVMVRYRFPGQRIADALIDMPLALPTAVAGIALTALFAPKGWFGAMLAPLGIKVAYTPLGILVALIFVGLPFMVRILEPRHQGPAEGRRGGSLHVGRDTLPDHPACRISGAVTRVAGGLWGRAGAWRGRIRVGDLHRRQPAHGQ